MVSCLREQESIPCKTLFKQNCLKILRSSLFLHFDCFPAHTLGIKGPNESELTVQEFKQELGGVEMRKLFAFLEGRTQVY